MARRNLWKNRGFSTLNIAGLAIGLATCFFIFQYVHFEKSFDRFNQQAPDLYRVLLGIKDNAGAAFLQPINHPAAGPALKREFPEVKDFARLVPSRLFMGTLIVSRNDPHAAPVAFNEGHVFFADPGVFRLFSFPVVQGNGERALSGGRSIAISQSEATKYFGQENPIGKTLLVNDRMALTVGAVFADIPANSHLKFDMLIAFNDGEQFGTDAWSWPEFYTYVRLSPGTDPQKLEKEFPSFVGKYLADEAKKYNFHNSFYLQPVTDIHLSSHYENELEVNGSEKEIALLAVIGLFVLVIAWINYINLTTAKGLERAKEIGVRKVVGATRRQLTGQFLTEALIVYLLALMSAAVLVVFLSPAYGQLTGVANSLSVVSSELIRQPGFWLLLAGSFIGGVLIMGAYPAWAFANVDPVTVLKGKIVQSGRGILLRKGLVLFQCVISLLLIAGSLLVYQQLRFMRNQSLGYNTAQLLIVKAPPVSDSGSYRKFTVFNNALQKDPTVLSVTKTSDIPGQTIVYNNGIRRIEQNTTQSQDTYLTEIDENFLKTFDIGIVSGRSLTTSESIDGNGVNPSHYTVMINETLSKALGYPTPDAAINRKISFGLGTGDVNGTILGVVKNYHQRSLKDPYDRILYYFPQRTEWRYVAIRVQPTHIRQTLGFIEKNYRSIFPSDPFESFFLNDYFNQQYNADNQFGTMFTLFTGLAILISCLGLLGLSSFTVRLRLKEIGIRKVLGASVPRILLLLYQEVFGIVLLATVICIPIVYFASNRWLSNYTFHIRPGAVFYLVPTILLLLITLLIVGVRSFQSARANPIDALRT